MRAIARSLNGARPTGNFEVLGIAITIAIVIASCVISNSQTCSFRSLVGDKMRDVLCTRVEET